jgi:hypothetical protein
MVKVHFDEGLTNHIGPESCAAVREGVREALTGVRAGQATERRNFALREAHALLTAEGNMAAIRFGKDCAVPRRQRPWHVRKSFRREPGDLHIRPGAPCSGAASGKHKLKPMMNGVEKSDPSIVPAKLANKARKLAGSQRREVMGPRGMRARDARAGLRAGQSCYRRGHAYAKR